MNYQGKKTEIMKQLTIILLLIIISLQIGDMLFRKEFTCNYDVATLDSVQESVTHLLENDSILFSNVADNASMIKHNTTCDISRAKDLLIAQDAIITILRRY